MLVLLLLLASVASTGSMPSSLQPIKVPEGWGSPVVVGGSAYINFSVGNEKSEDLFEIFSDLPRCMHEGASAKERDGWRLSVRDSKFKRRQQRKPQQSEGRFSGSSRKGLDKGGRMGFVAPAVLPAAYMNGPFCSTPKSVLGPTFLGTTGNMQNMGRATLREHVFSHLRASGLTGGGGGNQDNDKSKNGPKGFGKSEGNDRGVSGLRKQQMETPEVFREVEMYYTCNKCETRQKKRFTRNAYEKGVVIVV